jgi:hypothetical protein
MAVDQESVFTEHLEALGVRVQTQQELRIQGNSFHQICQCPWCEL